MFGWLKRKAQLKIVAAQEQDINRFILGLKGASPQEVGATVAIANHWRNLLENDRRWDLDHPDLVMVADPGAAMLIGGLIRRLQKDNPLMASGLMVWIHTLRASSTPEIRQLGREMWSQLARGIAHAEDASHGFAQLLNVKLDTRGVYRIPTNLRPLDG